MAKNQELEFSTTAGSNTDIGGLGIDEGMPPSRVNDGMRYLMKARADAITRHVAKAAGTYTAIKADHNQFWRCTGAVTLNLTAAATLTDGWCLYVRANGGAVTIDPAGAELIDGATTYVLHNGQTAMVLCTGTEFFLIDTGIVTAETRNRVVNPNFAISQENGNTAGTAGGYYAADQWQTFYTTSAGTFTSQRVQSVTPNGSKDRLRITITVADASLAAGEFLQIVQYIEGSRVADFRYGGSSARQSILRFGLKAPAGTYAVAIRNSASNRSYVALFTVSAANTDTEYSLVIPGDTSGTWLTDTGIGMSLSITLACGSTYQGTTGWQAGNFLGTSAVTNGMATGGNVFELYDVGLYLDDSTGIAPDWEAPDEARELAACKRYWQKYLQLTAVNYNSTGLNSHYSYILSVAMRIVPSISFSNVTNYGSTGPTEYLSTAQHLAFYLQSTTVNAVGAQLDATLNARM